MMVLGLLAKQCHRIARDHGFWDHAYHTVRDPVLGDVEARVLNPSIIPEKLALIHSEVSEALEAFRNDDDGNLEEELADVVIRVLDLAAFRGYDLETAILEKMRKNSQRPHMHGRKC